MPTLLNRETERAVLDDLLADLRSGLGRALVLRGEAGVGKSALLEYVTGTAADMRVARAAGVESEMELAFAGLHLLCAPLLDQLERLPVPQRDALGVAFGLREGGVPDRFLVGLAVLTLLSEVAEDRPCYAWSMTPSGWMRRRPRCWRSRRVGCWPSPSDWSSPRASRASSCEG